MAAQNIDELVQLYSETGAENTGKFVDAYEKNFASTDVFENDPKAEEKKAAFGEPKKDAAAAFADPKAEEKKAAFGEPKKEGAAAFAQADPKAEEKKAAFADPK